MKLSLKSLEQAVEIARRIDADEERLTKLFTRARHTNGNSNGVVRARGKRKATARAVVVSRRAKPTPRELARRKTAGKYMAAMRTLSAKQKVHVKAVREKDGVRAAITEAKSLAA